MLFPFLFYIYLKGGMGVVTFKEEEVKEVSCVPFKHVAISDICLQAISGYKRGEIIDTCRIEKKKKKEENSKCNEEKD